MFTCNIHVYKIILIIIIMLGCITIPVAVSGTFLVNALLATAFMRAPDISNGTKHMTNNQTLFTQALSDEKEKT